MDALKEKPIYEVLVRDPRNPEQKPQVYLVRAANPAQAKAYVADITISAVRAGGTRLMELAKQNVEVQNATAGA